MYFIDRRTRLRHGFTFIEVMIVVVIIGILAGVVTLSTRHFIDQAKRNRAKSDIATYSSAVEAFYAAKGRYPTTEEGLAVLTPQFIDRLRLDPWGNAYQYVQPGNTRPYAVMCYGADGREGGDGVNADISSEDDDIAGDAVKQASSN
jgi:general secretion pathway protein G